MIVTFQALQRKKLLAPRPWEVLQDNATAIWMEIEEQRQQQFQTELVRLRIICCFDSILSVTVVISIHIYLRYLVLPCPMRLVSKKICTIYILFHKHINYFRNAEVASKKLQMNFRSLSYMNYDLQYPDPPACVQMTNEDLSDDGWDPTGPSLRCRIEIVATFSQLRGQ